MSLAKETEAKRNAESNRSRCFMGEGSVTGQRKRASDIKQSRIQVLGGHGFADSEGAPRWIWAKKGPVSVGSETGLKPRKPTPKLSWKNRTLGIDRRSSTPLINILEISFFPAPESGKFRPRSRGAESRISR